MHWNCTFFTIAKNLLLCLNTCSQGLVVVWELNQERRGKPERIYVSSEHKGRKVTALCWDTAILRVFIGDHMGKVSAIKLNTSKQAKVRASPVLCVCRWDIRCCLTEFQLKDTIWPTVSLGDWSRAQTMNFEKTCLHVVHMVPWFSLTLLQNGFCELTSVICSCLLYYSIIHLHGSFK